MSRPADNHPGDRAGAPPGVEPDATLIAGERIAELRIVARPERLRIVRTVISEAAVAVGCSEQCVRDIVIAADEACQNVIRHAYGGASDGEILVDIRREGDRIALNIVDFAAPIDVSKVRPRSLDDLRPGGLGTHFIHACMDEAGFRTPPPGAGNRLWMTKRIQ